MREKALTYDDIQLVPQYSDVKSRSSVSLESQLTKNYKLQIPIVAAPMDTVCGFEMARKLMKLGAVGCVHRFMSVDEQVEVIEKLVLERELIVNGNLLEEHSQNTKSKIAMDVDRVSETNNHPIMAAVGVGNSELSRAKLLMDAGVDIFIIDVAHGHHENVKQMILSVKSLLNSPSDRNVDIIAGNIATYEAARDLCEWGVDGVRVGVGGGSLCSTRIETGHGVPNITSIEEIANACSLYDVPVMADGGIRMAGDIAKALAVGADTVMLGSLLAGTTESPGDVLEKGNHLYKRYRGSASLETKSANNQKTNHIEGVSTTIPYKGGVKFVIQRLTDGIRSAFSYSGAHNMMEYQTNAEYVVVTNAGITEAKPHLIK